jgi:hypothetical protein
MKQALDTSNGMGLTLRGETSGHGLCFLNDLLSDVVSLLDIPLRGMDTYSCCGTNCSLHFPRHSRQQHFLLDIVS